MGTGDGYHAIVRQAVIPVLKYSDGAGMLSLAHRATGAGGHAPSCDRGCAVAHAKAPQKTSDVLLGRGGPYADPSGDLLVGGTVRDQVDDLLLPGRQLGRGGFGPRLAAAEPGAEHLATVRELGRASCRERVLLGV